MKTWKNKYQQTAYNNNKQQYIDKARRHNIVARERNKKFLNELKQNATCPCGISDFRVMEFAHKDRSLKVGNLSDMANRPVSLNKLKEEVAKCDILCANCHRIQTFEEQKLIAG